MGEKIIKGHVVEKRYNPAKPNGEHAQLGRADDEFQLLVQHGHDSEQVWVNVSENEYNAVQVGGTFHGGYHRNLSGFRGVRKTATMGDPNDAAARAAASALVRDLSGW